MKLFSDSREFYIFAKYSGGAEEMAEIIPFEPDAGNAAAGSVKPLLYWSTFCHVEASGNIKTGKFILAKNYVTVLSIAGSDSIGGAGIQADIKTCCALGVYAMTAITAVTAQNTMGVDSYEAVTPELLRSQLESVIRDVHPDAVKIGMLPNLESQKIVASWLVENNIENVVLDPVMVATSGDSLTSVDNHRFLREHLMPPTTLVTPNIPEAMSLSGSDDSNVDAMGEQLLKYCRAVLVKGGHATSGEFLADVLYRHNCEPAVYSHPKIETVNTHGTGCSLSTAIACKLALGLPLEEAVAHAIEWLQSALLRGKNVVFGHGHGPVAHLGNYNLSIRNETESK